MNINFWKNKKVFLTGHTGFKGSWAALWLQQLGAELTGYALKPPTKMNLFTFAHISENMHSIEGDIRDFDKLHKSLQNCQPDIIIHMAAQPLVRVSYQKPLETYETNIMGTVHLLEAARYCKNLRVILNITSDKCYENKERYTGYVETDPMGGYDPYSSSKGCAELVTTAYRHSFYKEIALASARAGNVIGGGDWALDRLIPDIVRAIKAEKQLYIRYPDAVRPWQHVLEPLSGYLSLIEKCWIAPAHFSQGWNFGPAEHDVKSVRWVVKTFLQYWNMDIDCLIDERKHPYESSLLKLDISKAKNHLHWNPILNLDKAITWTVNWYQMWDAMGDLKAYTLQQIQEYQNNICTGHSA